VIGGENFAVTGVSEGVRPSRGKKRAWFETPIPVEIKWKASGREKTRRRFRDNRGAGRTAAKVEKKQEKHSNQRKKREGKSS